MKKVIVFFALIMCGVNAVIAAPVSYSKAKVIADRFVSSYAIINGEEAKLVYSPMLPNQNRPAFYVFNYGNDTFVIVSGDDLSYPILGYSFLNGFPSSVPSNIQTFLSDLAMELDAAIEQRIPQGEDVAQQWEGLMYGTVSPKDASDTIGPLLTTQWDQGQYYNSFCPVDPTTQNHTPTGCVATAMAQIIKYWQYPVNPRGSYSYSSNYGTLGINLDTVTYNFLIMPNKLNSTSTNDEVNEVAALLYHCGVTLHMDYDTLGSSANSASARAALTNHFGYSANMNIASKSYYSYSWNNMLKTELDANRPVLYRGTDPSNGGHSFVCDGYSGNYFHFNFGWSGWGDGYFLTSAINPTLYGILDLGQYNSSQAAIFGIQPDSSASTLFSQYIGNSQFVVDRPLDFYNIKALNTYSSNQFSNICSHKITFTAQDTANRLLLEIINPNSENLYIYDGDGTTSQIRHLTGNNTAASLSPVISSSPSLTLWDLGYSYNNGFQIRVSELNDTTCYAVANVQLNVIGDSVRLTWLSSGSSTAWQVEYGISGFSHGSGTLVTVDSTIITFAINDIQDYDFYVRSICDSTHFSQWSQTLSYVAGQNNWVDVVTSCPSGYTVDGAGNVTISSPAGLAWLISVVNGLNGQTTHTLSGKTVTLTTDVDMGMNNWTAINGFAGRFDGNGHTISKIVVDETSMYQGLFGRIQNSNASIDNLILDSCNITGGMYTGSLCGDMSGSLNNCSVSGTVSGSSYVGGLVGRLVGGEVANSSSSAGIIATNGYAGGLVGLLRGGIIINSYSHGNMVCLGNYIGGVVGNASALYGDVEIVNCYYSGIVIGGTSTGSVIGELNSSYSHNTVATNLYSNYTLKPLVASTYSITSSTVINDTALFSHNDLGNPLSVSVVVDNNAYSDLMDALNAKVELLRDTSLRMWTYSATSNEGYPEHGEYYHESCSSPSGIVVDSLWASGCSLSWNNADAIAWQIEYGLQGYEPGNGTIINVNTPTVTLSNLTSYATYDIYIRGLCADSSFSQRSLISVIIPYAATEYWYEVVTSQPSGYIVASNYDVHISSREGLAWLLSVCNGLNGAPSLSWQTKRIVLDCDVDMSEYRWLPMKLHKSFNGSMHTITGLTINEDSSMYVGFIESLYSSDTICNIVFSNCNINNEYAYGYTGGVVGSCNGTIFNCGISGSVSSLSDNTGGIAGNNFGNIINCYSTANVSGRRYVGGISGDNASYGNTHSVLNCYATGNIISNNPYTYLQDYAGVATGKASENGNGDYLAYWLQGSQPQVGCGNNIAGFYPFNGSGTQWTLINSTTIESQTTSILVDALNIWVSLNNEDDLLCNWAIDSNNINGGLPFFAHNVNVNDTIYYTLTVSCNDYSMGSVSGSGVYSAGSVVTISASPYAGYAFIHWSDDDTNAVRTITLMQDISLIAYFSASNPQGIDNQESERVIVYSANNRIHINNNNNENVVIYTIDGKMVCEGVIKQSPYLANGVYLVKVGNMQVVKVTVIRK